MADPLQSQSPQTAGPAPIVAGEIRVTSWRRVWVATAGGVLTCVPDPVDGHRFHDHELVWEHGCLRCRHKITRGGAECGRLVYLVGGGLVNPRGLSLIILAEVAVPEFRRMTDERMDHDRALEFLGIRFPG